MPHDAPTPPPPPDAAAESEAARPLDPDVIATLVANHRQFLAFLERRVGSRDTAEEILQNAFVRGIDKQSTLRDGESATAWFYRLLRNAVIDHYRRRGAEQRAMDAAAREADGDAAAPPDAEMMNAVCQCVTGLLDTLKPEYAEALRQVELGGAQVRAFAEQRGITPNNAAVRVFRAREALRTQLTRACGTCASHGCLDCTCGSGGHGKH